MIRYKKIACGKKHIETLLFPLGNKNLIVLRARKGYCMCGYLNLNAAGKFKDAAIKIVGVSTIEEALRAKVHSCTRAARRLGVYKGQPLKAALTCIC